jgi:GH15 family glucan-1,4-alpha-glucosidase
MSPQRPDLLGLVESSRVLIARHQAPSGAYPAGPTFRVYRYSWFRDGAFIADGVSRHGDVEGASAFHEWCAQVLVDRSERVDLLLARSARGEQIDRSDFLPTRYTLDGADEADDDWWNFQLDGYGTWLWALRSHLQRHDLSPAPYARAVGVAARYLAVFGETPCYDWWEEHPEHVHTATLAAVEAGLRSALALGVLDEATAPLATKAAARVRARVLADARAAGHLTKWAGTEMVDGSLLAAVAPFATVDGILAAATVRAVEQELVVDHGVYRYRADTFYGGGRWPVLAAFLGLAYVGADRSVDALAQLDWMASCATVDGFLPEQVSDLTLHPDYEDEWVQRWGTVATPLLWSHGMFLTLADALGVRP